MESSGVLTGEGKDVKIELTESLVKLIYYKKSEIESIREIPRDSVIKSVVSKDEFRVYIPASSDPTKQSYLYMFFGPEQRENFERIAEELGHGFWYEDKIKTSHIVSYNNEEQASLEAEKAAMKGWIPQGTSATDGHINVGRTVARTLLTGGIGLAIGGASRTKGKVTITYIRTPEWLTSNNKAMSPPSVLTSDPQPTDDPLQKMKQLKGMLDAGLINESEYNTKKADLLSRM